MLWLDAYYYVMGPRGADVSSVDVCLHEGKCRLLTSGQTHSERYNWIYFKDYLRKKPYWPGFSLIVTNKAKWILKSVNASSTVMGFPHE